MEKLMRTESNAMPLPEIYFRLIRTIGSMGTASVSYLKPAVGILVGCTLMGESLTWTAAAA
jgi:hypothetical protein